MKKINNMKDAFLNEWGMYVQDFPVPGNVYKYVKAEGYVGPNDVRSGQIRLLADIEPQLMVYVHRKRHGGFSWEAIPLSPFHFPATSGEALIGRRVYQFWNMQEISAYVIGRSFAVEDVPIEERRELHQMIRHIEVGDPLPEYLKVALGAPVRDGKDKRLRYLADFSIDASTFRCNVKGQSFTSLSPRVIEQAFDGYEFAAAAAGVENDYTTAVVADRFPRNAKDFKNRYVECELKSQFLSLLPGERGERPLVYTWEGDAPKAWRNSPVAAYVAKTGEMLGVGFMDIEAKRIVINDFSVSDGVSVAIEKASELRLILVQPRGRGHA